MKTPKTHIELLSARKKTASFWREHWRQYPYFSVAKELFNLRRNKGLSQAELAKKSATHQSRISGLESADLDFRLSTLIPIAEAFNTHVEIHFVPNVDYYEGDLTEQFFAHMKAGISTGGAQGFSDPSNATVASMTVPA